jgi:HSP20 family protein
MSLRDAMSQLLEQAVLRPGFAPMVGDTGTGHMDVIEANGRYYCQVALPGVDPGNIELTVRQNTLTLRAKLSESFPEALRKEGTYLLRELGTGEITRAITFPKDVNGDAVTARCEQGMLWLEMPVAEHAQPKRIAIQSDKTPQTKIIEEPSVAARQQGNEALPVNGHASPLTH